jgi:O-antigen/teichoic acid export membrane protein
MTATINPTDSTTPSPSLFSEAKRLLRLSGIYASGDILTLGLGLILLPLYTAYLTPNDYGILGIATLTTTLCTILLPLGLHGSAFKFYFDPSIGDRKRFYGNLWILLVVFPGLILIVVDLMGDRLFRTILTQIPYSPYIRIAIWTSFFIIAFTSFLLQILRASEKAAYYAVINIGQFVLAAGMTLWFVAGLRYGVQGALWARLIAVVILASLSAAVLWRRVNFTPDMDFIKRALRYGLPLVPHHLSFWILAASDRFILEWYVPLSDVGIYTIAYQIGSISMIFLLAGNNSLVPLFGRLNNPNQADFKNLMRIVTYYIFGLTIIGLVICLFFPFAIKILTPPSYHSATVVVPWIVLGYIFMGLYLPCSNTIILIVGQSRKIGFFTLATALLNIGLNIWLIPKFGMIVAAVTTAASYLFLFATVFLYAYMSGRLPFETRRIAIVLAAGFLTFFAGWHFASRMGLGNLLLTSASVLIFPIFLWISRFFNKQERSAAVQVYTRIRGRA